MDVDLGSGAREEFADEALARIGADLAAAVRSVAPRWVESSVVALATAWSGSVSPGVRAAAVRAGKEAASDVGDELEQLLAADVDAQWTNPMAVVRRIVRHATVVLRDAGVGELVRPAEDEAHFPDDPYGLTPRTFADVDPSLHELGMLWGAVKARAHLIRHRRGPLR